MDGESGEEKIGCDKHAEVKLVHELKQDGPRDAGKAY